MNEQCAAVTCAPATCITDLGDTISVTVPIKWRRTGGRKQIILPDNLPEEEPRKPSPLLIALSRSCVWNRWLDEGKCLNAKELASAVGIEASMVRRILRLGTLNPRFVESVIGGAEPGVSLDRLMNGDVVGVWGEQEVEEG